MTPARWRIAAIALAGALAFFCLHLLFLFSWDWFIASPWPGYAASTRAGFIEPWFVHSPRSLWLTRAVFFAVAFAIAVALRDRFIAAAFAFWIGAGIAVAVAWATTRAHTIAWGALGYLFYPFRLLLPVALGTLAGRIVRRFAGRASVRT
jgi:hypothetical protein